MKKITQLGLCMLALLFNAACSKSSQSDTVQLLENSKNQASTSSTALPGNRAYYVVTVMGGTNYTQTFGRICQLTFTTAGTVSMSYNNWSFTFPGENQYNTWKKLTGYNTSGCIIPGGVVKAPAGFQPTAQGGAWLTTTGTYYISQAPGLVGKVVINWASGQQEIWTVSNPSGKAYSRLDIYSSSNIKHGYGFGSTKNFNNAVNMAAIKTFGTMPMAGWSNNWAINDFYFSSTFTSSLDSVCLSNGNVMTGPETAPLVCGRYHNYLAGNPATDKRKVYWNHQLGSVGCAEAGTPCPNSSCSQVVISPGGGHTSALLQVIDDNGNFKGFVGLEASLNGHYTGGAVITAFVAYQ